MPELCDRLGFYLISESDVEAHGVCTASGNQADYAKLYPTIAADPDWSEAIVDRVQRNVIRDKNHPSVVICRSAMKPAGASALQMLPTGSRNMMIPVWFITKVKTGAAANMTIIRKNSPTSICAAGCTQPYRPFVITVKTAKTKSRSFFANTSMQWASGPGDAEEYWQLVMQYPNFCGGFVWEWCDHAVLMGNTVDGNQSTDMAATLERFCTTAISAWMVWSIPTAPRRPALLNTKNVIPSGSRGSQSRRQLYLHQPAGFPVDR